MPTLLELDHQLCQVGRIIDANLGPLVMIERPRNPFRHLSNGVDPGSAMEGRSFCLLVKIVTDATHLLPNLSQSPRDGVGKFTTRVRPKPSGHLVITAVLLRRLVSTSSLDIDMTDTKVVDYKVKDTGTPRCPDEWRGVTRIATELDPADSDGQMSRQITICP